MEQEDPKETMFVQCWEDDDFPTKVEISEEDKNDYIFKLFKKIIANPSYDFSAENNEYKALKMTQDDFKVSKGDLDKVKDIHSKQLKTLFNGEMKDDKNIGKMLAISAKSSVNAPYLLFLADMFSRDRITSELNDGKTLEPGN